MSNLVIKPVDTHEPIGRAYNHVIKTGNTIFVSGQVALDKDGNVVGEGDIVAQAEQVFKNLQSALAAAGASFEDVVKSNTYLTRRDDLAKLREVRSRYFIGEPPASTLVFVSGLAMEEFLIEVEAIAVLS